MYDIAGERSGAGNPTWLEYAKPAAKHAGVIATAACSRRDHRRQDDLRRILLQRQRHQRALRHARQCSCAGPPARRLIKRLGGGRRRRHCDIALGSDTGGSIRIPGVVLRHLRIGGRRMAASIFRRHRHGAVVRCAGWFAATPGVFRNVGAVLLDGAKAEAAIERLIIADDCFSNGDEKVGIVLMEVLARGASLLPKSEHQTVAPKVDEWREAFHIVQAFETWQSFGDFVTRAKPSPARASRNGWHSPRP